MRPEQENKALTGLRGVAALMVCVHHVVKYLGPPPSPAQALALRCYLMVDMFFVLSGFVMALAYEGWFAGGFRVETYARFLWRRFARLWPLHAFILVALLVEPALAGRLWAQWRVAAVNLAMVQGWGVSRTLNGPSWSLSAEWCAYAAFPVLSGLVLRGGRARAVAAAVAAAALLILAAHLGRTELGGLYRFVRRGPLDLYDNYSLLPVMRCLGGFTLGLVARRVMRSGALAEGLAHPVWAWGAGVLLAGGLAFGMPDWVAYPLLVLLVAALWAGEAGLSRLLARPGPHRLGAWSYALYLVHVPVIEHWAMLGPRVPPLAAGVALIAISLALAGVLHRVVEVPARRALRRVEPAGAAVAAE